MPDPEKRQLGETIAGIQSRANHALKKAEDANEYTLATKRYLLRRISLLEKEIKEQTAIIANHIERSRSEHE